MAWHKRNKQIKLPYAYNDSFLTWFLLQFILLNCFAIACIDISKLKKLFSCCQLDNLLVAAVYFETVICCTCFVQYVYKCSLWEVRSEIRFRKDANSAVFIRSRSSNAFEI